MKFKNLLYALPVVALIGASASPAMAQVVYGAPMPALGGCCATPVVSVPYYGCGYNAGPCGFGGIIGAPAIGVGLSAVLGPFAGAGTGLFSGWQDINNNYGYGYRYGHMAAPGYYWY